MKTLEGKTALITGAARNIGRAIALRLANDGANIVVNGLGDPDAANAVADEVRARGVEAAVQMGDAGNHKDCQALVAAAEPLGGVDILVLNASRRGQKPFLEMTHAEFRDVIDLTLDSAFHLAQAVIPSMQSKAWGRIVGLGGVSW